MSVQFVPLELDVPRRKDLPELAFTPEECAEPPKAEELSDWNQYDYDLDARMAAKLGFGFGGLNISSSQRLLVREFTRSKVCSGEDGKRYRYGTAVRLIVKVNNIAGGGSLTLPFVAAETQFGRMEASSSLKVIGYVGSQLAGILPPFRTFNVDAYAEMSTKMNEVKRLIGEDVENVRPEKLGVEVDSDEQQMDVKEALGLIWGLTCAAKGKSCKEARDEYPDREDPSAIRGIQAAYDRLPSSTGCSQKKPTRIQRVTAQEELKGMELRS